MHCDSYNASSRPSETYWLTHSQNVWFGIAGNVMVWLTANAAALLATPLAVTTTGPGPGARHVIDVAAHVVVVAVQPLNVT
jgi:hypothetical protein